MKYLLVCFLVLLSSMTQAQIASVTDVQSITDTTTIIAIPIQKIDSMNGYKIQYPDNWKTNRNNLKPIIATYQLQDYGWSDPDYEGEWQFAVLRTASIVNNFPKAKTLTLDQFSTLTTEVWDRKEYEIADSNRLMELLAKNLQGVSLTENEMSELDKSNAGGIYRKVPSLRDITYKTIEAN